MQKIKNGEVKLDQLVLHEKSTARGREWTIKSADDGEGQRLNLDGHVLAQGIELQNIILRVLHNTQVPDKFTKISEVGAFKAFCRRVPGLDTPEVAAARQKIQEGLKPRKARIRAIMSKIGRGISDLHMAGMPARPVRAHGRSSIPSEVIMQLSQMPGKASEKLADIWRGSDTQEDYVVWLETVQTEWATSGTSAELLPWLAAKDFGRREVDAWRDDKRQQAGLSPKEEVPFDDKDFKVWQEAQYDPSRLLAEPLWIQRKDYEQSVNHNAPVTFDEWVQSTIQNRENYWENAARDSEGMISYTKGDTATFRKLDEKMFAYNSTSGSVLDGVVWCARELWAESGVADPSDNKAWAEYMEHAQYTSTLQTAQPYLDACLADLKKLSEEYDACPAGEKDRALGISLLTQIETLKHKSQELQNMVTNTPSFESWKDAKEQKLQKRWEATHTSLNFEEWKSQQLLDPAVAKPFVRLNAQERKNYQAECIDGNLMRAGQIFSTVAESTSHHGAGWVIFVLDPKQQLYCSSHLPGVFHHSSFLSNAAIMAGGEIKTNAAGKIVELSGKSGHYKPGDTENRAMLKWFMDRGVDLSKVSFSGFLGDGKESDTVNALDYYQGLVQLKPKKGGHSA